MRALLLFSAYLVFHIQIATQVLKRNFVTSPNIKFKCTTVKSSFATEDDLRMSKHVLQIKKCRFFIESYRHAAVFTSVWKYLKL